MLRVVGAAAVALVVLAGCDKTLWHGPSLCREQFEIVERDHDPSNPNADYTTLLAGVKAIGGKEKFIASCGEAIADAVTACKEYKFKSDQGISCTERRIYPAMHEYVGTVMLAGERARAEAAQR